MALKTQLKNKAQKVYDDPNDVRNIGNSSLMKSTAEKALSKKRSDTIEFLHGEIQKFPHSSAVKNATGTALKRLGVNIEKPCPVCGGDLTP